MIYGFLSGIIPHEKIATNTNPINFIEVQNVIQNFDSNMGIIF